MEACVPIGIVNDSLSIGNCAWFTACIDILFILQTLTKKQTRT
ncbi:RpiR family transcriptional regulator [Bacillus pseudomycoides]|nr:RpiR family transcriptional regulator [Bacillus pseudomycoides]